MTKKDRRKYRRRLLRVADLVESLEPAQLRMGDWFQDLGGRDCGTAACAIGWACRDRKLAGLVINDYGEPTLRDCPFFDGWDAVIEYFGLDSREARHLFYIGSYPESEEPSPAMVAGRIRRHVQDSLS